MTDKLTDLEIKKVLEECIELRFDDTEYATVRLDILTNALDLITRQQAEIERLKECPKCVYEYDGEIMEYCAQSPCPNFKTVEQIKAEAYKEFAKLLRQQAFDKFYVSVDEINNLLKEMVGEDNAKEKE